ncbi:MAG: DUF3047 domain-containing protein [Alphaproteobacteria bacterium]
MIAGRTPLLAVVLLLLVSCGGNQTSVIAPEGLLSVLGPFPGFSPVELPGDWSIEGDEPNAEQIAVTRKDGIPALHVTNGEKAFIIVRRIRAMMLATPYLSWSWNIEPPSTTGFHPVRVVVGFKRTDPETGGWVKQPYSLFGSDLPPHDRAISLTWGESALQRGTLSVPTARQRRAAPRYTVRGGRENAGSWWLETVDLSELYRRAWPDADPGTVQVVFVGIAAPGGRAPAPAYVSGIILSR